MSRQVVTLNLTAGNRVVTIRATADVGPEDAIENLMHSILHRYVTGEDLTMPVPREVKDWIIRSNLTV